MDTIVGGLFLIGGVVGLVLISMSPRVVRSGGKPLAEPRILHYLDAWQTMIFDAGRDSPRIREQLLALFSKGTKQGFACTTELIWHWGLDGKIEREQIVLRHGRAVVFCQVHQYGSDLYVGWDAHLNVGTWKETAIASGIDRETGRRVKLMNVEQAAQPTGEYDLVDLNCLLEWTHAQVTKVLKQYLKEREIDQEIDFAIIRGDRQQATQPGQKEKGRKPLRNLFRRTA